jgi:hypothetical protein
VKYVSFFLLFALLAMALPAPAQQNSTLADVLKQNSIPLASIPNLNSQVTSYSVLNDDQEFVIAYYLPTKDDLLRWPLYVSRLNKRIGQWQNRELRDVKLVTERTGTL